MPETQIASPGGTGGRKLALPGAPDGVAKFRPTERLSQDDDVFGTIEGRLTHRTVFGEKDGQAMPSRGAQTCEVLPDAARNEIEIYDQKRAIRQRHACNVRQALADLRLGPAGHQACLQR